MILPFENENGNMFYMHMQISSAKYKYTVV